MVGTVPMEAHFNCAADGAVGCVTTGSYKAADMALAIASNIVSGATIAAVGGSATTEAHVNCAADGVVGCITTGSFKPANMTVAIAGNIRTGVVIAGVTGTVPTYSSCSTDGATGCVTVPAFKSASTAAAVATNIRSGIQIAGVTGSISNCAADGAIGCITVSGFKAADATLATAANIRNGAVVAGVTGTFPSASAPLSGGTSDTDLNAGNFNASIKSSSPFEWWDAYGGRHGASGSAAIISGNIGNSVNIFGTVGTLPNTPCGSDGATGCVIPPGVTQYKVVDSSLLMPEHIRFGRSIAGLNGGLKYCKNNGSSQTSTVEFNSTDLWGGESCDTLSTHSFQDMTGGLCTFAGADCKYKDIQTNLTWSKMFASAPYSTGGTNAMNSCNTYTLDGGGWRLPTQKELHQAYIDGIRAVWNNNNYWMSLSTSQFFWSTTTNTGANAGQHAVNLYTGEDHGEVSTNSLPYLCVKQY